MASDAILTTSPSLTPEVVRGLVVVDVSGFTVELEVVDSISFVISVRAVAIDLPNFGIFPFLAVYLTFRRSPYYAIGYAANDIVLIVLWVLAALDNKSYISVVVCFTAFLANDVYDFFSWRKMEKRQAALM